MENLEMTKVSKIVARNFRTAKVFTTYGIDFCCNGGIPLHEACSQKGADVQTLVRQLEAALLEPDTVDYSRMSLSQLIDHIVSIHHQYIETTAPVLKTYLAKLCMVHGERHPELHRIKALFDEGAGVLAAHMKKEELILFPYIDTLWNAHNNGADLPPARFGHIDNPIAMMEMEHAGEGERFRQIAVLSNNYSCPPDGCQTYRVAYALLDEFEKDLHLHIHLENNLLFPAAKTLFNQMASES